MDDPVVRKAQYYLDVANKSPFAKWISSRRVDGSIRARIYARIRRIEEFGNYGDCEPVGDGVYELKVDVGPGYRVYFGIDQNEIILLLGGDKSSQESDISKAKWYWGEYNAEADQ